MTPPAGFKQNFGMNLLRFKECTSCDPSNSGTITALTE